MSKAAQQTQHKPQPAQPGNSQQDSPRTVLVAQPVELAFVTYVDENNQRVTSLAVVGTEHVHMLEGRTMGFSKNTTRQGPASDWLRDGIFKLLGR